MASWKGRMQSSDAEVSMDSVEVTASSRSEVTAGIRQCWEKEWDKPQQDLQGKQDRWYSILLQLFGKLAARKGTV